jgi:hypothetical protein
MTARLVEIGKAWHTRLRGFFDGPPAADAPPLELLHAVLAEIERKVQPLGRGRRVFPYGSVLVRLGPTAADRPSLQAAFDSLPAKVLERLTELDCTAPEPLEVRTVFLKKAPTDWGSGRLFALECRSAPEVAADPREEARIRTVAVAIEAGAATQAAYSFAQSVVSIGRTAEPTDAQGRVRRNDVVFLDAVDGITETVGRAHARLQFDPATRAYRLFNDSGSNPTIIVRDGRSVQVPAGDPRGVRMRSGDEVRLGRAVVRITLDGK